MDHNKPVTNNLLRKFKNLKQKGPLFYVRHTIKSIKRNNKFFGRLYLTFFKHYKIGNVKIFVDKNLFPVTLYSRFLFNVYEQEEVSLVYNYLKGNETVLELGACIGVVSCVTNKRLSNPKNHVVAEANPELIKYIQHNKELNNCKFSVLNGAVSDLNELTFYAYEGRALSGSLMKESTDRPMTEHLIKGYSPRDIEKKYNLKFDTLIMDIEGGEFELIDKYRDWIKSLKLLMIEFHPKHLNKDTDLEKYLDIIQKECGFILTEYLSGTLVFKNAQIT